MRVRWTGWLVAVVALGGCSWFYGPQKYSVYFEPYSDQLDPQAGETVHAAAKYAQDHPLKIVALDGFAAPPDPTLDVDGLSAQRAEIVKRALVSDGIKPERITVAANGVTDPTPLPSVAVRRVDISFRP